MKRIWIAPVVAACLFGGLFTQSKLREKPPTPQIEEQVKQLYNEGRTGVVRTHPLPPAPDFAPQSSAVTYGFSGGRLGDNLLSYLHARWIAYRDHVPFVFKPFPGADAFALSLEASSDTHSEVVEIPYFPEPSMKNRDHPFVVDWDDPGFREEIARCLAPVNSHTLLELPADRISICAHVRRGGNFDSLEAHYEQPLKFPPDSYYIEQIRRIAHIFESKPLYVFLMTDDLDPQALTERYQRAVAIPHIQWACRTTPPENDLDDFFSIPKFDCLILCDSNFSIVASKLAKYAVRIAPTHYSKKKNEVRITGVEISFNPTQTLFSAHSP